MFVFVCFVFVLVPLEEEGVPKKGEFPSFIHTRGWRFPTG